MSKLKDKLKLVWFYIQLAFYGILLLGLIGFAIWFDKVRFVF